MKRLLILVLCLCLAFCAATASAVSYTAGTFEGRSENGRNGEIKVTVTFSEDAITEIEVTEHQETPGVADPAIERVPADVVRYQSLGIDSIAGATLTSNALLEAVADAATKAGADVEALRAVKVEKELSTEVVERKTNLLVIGGGAAGLSAAISAAYEGETDIVLLEKEAALGGNAIRSGGFIENLEPDEENALLANEGYGKMMEEMMAEGPRDEMEAAVWDDLTRDYEAYKASGSKYLFDCPALLAIEYYRVEGTPPIFNMGYPSLVNVFDHWFVDEIGGKLAPQCGIVGYTWPRWTYVRDFSRGAGYFHYMTKYMQEKNLPIEVLTSTPAKKLLTDESGAVIGAEAVADDGTTYRILASKGVLLATGGFSANGEMLLQYDEQWGITTPDVKHDNSPGVTGDGILMAQEIGASLSGMENIMMFPLGSVSETNDVTAVPFNGSSTLLVSNKGERFVNETASRFEICHAAFKLESPVYYAIADTLNAGLDDATQEQIDASVAHGSMYRGETLEELAKALGCDPAIFTATVEQYNHACETFTDELFGRTTFMDGSAIVQGPFYATPLTPVAHITIGGIDTDTNGRVLNAQGEIIPGLYAAGETVSGSCGISAFAYGKEYARRIVTGDFE